MRQVLGKWWAWPIWARVLSGAIALFFGSAVVAAAVQGPQKADNVAGSSLASVLPSATTSPMLTTDVVPVLVGFTRANAVDALTSAGLVVGHVDTRVSTTQPAGTVLSEAPVAGATVQPGSRVALVVAAAPPRVPAVVGMSAARAESILHDAGFTVSTSARTVRSGSDGVVLSESPAGGGSAMPDSNVQITVSHLYVPPPPPPAAAPPAQQSCTTTNSGSCIRGGQFCRQADYGTTGYDAYGRSWTCTGDETHPHWE